MAPNLRVFMSAIDVFRKLKHEVSKIEVNIHVYDFFNFVITAHILQEWLLKDSSLPDSVRLKAKEIEKNQFWQACKEISTGKKYFSYHETKTSKGISHVRLNLKRFDWELSLKDGEYKSFLLAHGCWKRRYSKYTEGFLNRSHKMNVLIKFY